MIQLVIQTSAQDNMLYIIVEHYMNSNYAQICVRAFGMLAIMFSLPYSNQGVAFMCYVEHPTLLIKEHRGFI